MVRNKNRIRSNNLRTIRRAFPRFASLMVMSFLGVFVFAGLTATAPDMIQTLDDNLDEHAVYDLRVISDMGLDQADVDAISALDGVEAVEAAKALDAISVHGDNDCVISLTSLPQQLNCIDLLEGRMPEQPDEIVVEQNFLSKEGMRLGDTIILEQDGLTEKQVTIVGTVNSALYYNNVMIKQSRGSTSIGSGTIAYYAYGMEALFDMEYDTVIFLTVDGAKEAITSEKDYTSLVQQVETELEEIEAAREQARYDTIYRDADAELEDARRKSDNALDDAWQELTDAKEELDNSKEQLDQSKEQLDAARETLDQQKTALDSAAVQVEYLKASYGERSAVYTQALSQYEASEAQYTAAESTYEDNLDAYEAGMKTWQDGEDEYEAGLAEYYESQAEAEQEISDAEQALEELKMPTWYIYDRTGDSTYTDYIDDSNSIRNLATIFPIVFFAVAVLVSLISMNRMVEEDRLEIGTMKSMGFPETMIMSKYLVFSLLATLIGGLLGALSGLVVIPELIFNIYSILFTLPSLTITLQPLTTILGFVLTIVCVCGTSVWTVSRVLVEKPAALLRPKAPKNGKRILLERIPLIWNHIKFSRKVTARNIFRYKKRVLVTIGGIAGCTALMLSGFGVKDAIIDVPSEQYYHIYQFDATAYVSDYGADGVQASDFLDYEHVTTAVPAQRITAELEGIDGYLQIVGGDADLKEIADFRDQTSGEKLTLETGKAIINEKLAAMKGLEVGDTITLVDVDNHTISVEIGGIASNYIEHFVYMDAETYEELGYNFEPNLVYLHTDSLDQQQKDTLTEEILLNDHILSFAWRDTLIENVDDSLQSLNSVVLILIVLSALLAFVVLYNLSNININERRREIATLKVLGFYNREVDSYITKENILLTILGILLGLLMGIFLSHAVVSTIEVEKCRFMNELKPLSYLWSALMSAGFTVIVNVITHFNLKRINMIDSLKSVE